MFRKIEWSVWLGLGNLLVLVLGGVASYLFIDQQQNDADLKLKDIQIDLAKLDKQNKEIQIRLDIEQRDIDKANDFINLIAKLKPNVEVDSEHKISHNNGILSIQLFMKNIGTYAVLYRSDR